MKVFYTPTDAPVAAAIVVFHTRAAVQFAAEKAGTAAAAPRLVLDDPAGAEIHGDFAIARYLARLNPEFAGGLFGGASALAAAEVDQWVDFAITSRAVAADGGDARSFVSVVNSALASRTFLAGYSLTFADIAAFAVLLAVGEEAATGSSHIQRWAALCHARLPGRKASGVLRLDATRKAAAAGAAAGGAGG
eukprot:CAMPEP_0203829700 /NCGR_PEP_ID=MMETSP0115-20131106/64109_1 /ASSEMBLY_ACC=CAM_ASM_000227 /TAXON_ID=33651 /ORGANISM="Bicosoecid sp, Strain ms1" /LENGTH=191 /DNA_ID=CAMNT_0050738761 /DNA_START=37 /DNA_END=608 /DNA_ORIENTATION=-